MGSNSLGEPVLGIYRRCEDPVFLRTMAEFVDANAHLLESTRVGHSPGATILNSQAFEGMDMLSVPHMPIGEGADLDSRPTSDVVIPEFASIAVKFSIERGRHYDIERLANEVRNSLSEKASRPITALLGDTGSLSHMGEKYSNIRRIHHFGMFFHEGSGAQRQVLNERHLSVQAITNYIRGEAVPCRRIRLGPISDPHITIGEVRERDIYGLRRAWNESSMPGAVTLGPVEVVVLDRSNNGKRVS